jgi:hypothetical protein
MNGSADKILANNKLLSYRPKRGDVLNSRINLIKELIRNVMPKNLNGAESSFDFTLKEAISI